ncbi:uncharacterized protein LOC135962186 [Calliphora vicina]|uniref:uncharacterized protein LOC135962186 n=1 Tax=Calliphora vicina TaxID=7373 RepID=UPI00325BED63
MDSHSKNVCLIGVLHIVGCAVFSLEPLVRAIGNINSEENDEQGYDGESIFLLASVGCYILLATLAGLMIRGVVKQRHLLVAPFLIISCLFLPALIVIFLMEEYQGSIYFCQDTLYSIGVQIMVVYPIYTLYMKLRSNSLKEKSQLEPSCGHEKKDIGILTQKLCV